MPEATTTPKTPNNTYQAQGIPENPQSIVLKESENENAISNQNPPKYIRKKYTYNKFKKIVKKGGYTSARLVAKALGVDYHTILDWTNTPQVIELMREDLSTYTKKIKASKDWKAQAYLLDKLLDDKEQTNINILTLEGLTIVRK